MVPDSKEYQLAFLKMLPVYPELVCKILIFPRFTVSTVESETKKNGIHMGASIISRPLRSSAETAANGQSETWLHDAGWKRKRSLAQLTREALPRMENYRNSKRALKRPSLGELHGDHLIREEVGTYIVCVVKVVNECTAQSILRRPEECYYL